jgi:glutamine amidotransferase
MNAFRHVGEPAVLTGDLDTLRKADALIMPGDGAFGATMDEVRSRGLVPVLQEAASAGKTLLGICIGMQVLFERSEEGDVAGLGLLPGEVRMLPSAPGVRLPHMGWNRLQKRAASPLLDGIDDGAQAYFVHSYGVTGSDDAIAEADHGGAFAAAVARGHVVGAQFHPERSGEVGARFLRNFLAWQPS